jgi:hypothetical protein
MIREQVYLGFEILVEVLQQLYLGLCFNEKAKT